MVLSPRSSSGYCFGGKSDTRCRNRRDKKLHDVEGAVGESWLSLAVRLFRSIIDRASYQAEKIQQQVLCGFCGSAVQNEAVNGSCCRVARWQSGHLMQFLWGEQVIEVNLASCRIRRNHDQHLDHLICARHSIRNSVVASISSGLITDEGSTCWWWAPRVRIARSGGPLDAWAG